MCVCVFITAGPSTKLFACGGGILEDMCYKRRRAEACVDKSAHHALCLCLLLQDLVQSCLRGGAVGVGGHVLRETTSRGLCAAVVVH
jgi:hypothetical protein